jgi:phosphatidylserine/phosphatidylglycerophosphate/cardiolipin synthase-like enzyme
VQPEEARLLESVGAAARELPRSVVEQLCDVLVGMAEDAPPGERASLSAIVASSGVRLRISGLMQAWNSAPTVGPTSLAWALRAASDADERRRHEQTIELVWTGPSPEGTVLRRTDQVLLDLIRSAQHTLHIMTFAAYKIPILNEAMLRAARSGVETNLIFEAADAGKVSFAATRAVGEELEALCNIYIWPPEERPKDPAGRYGSLHAKCAVADANAVLISSANLTEYALALNMELGLLVRGGELPSQVVAHLRQLIEDKVLTRL